MIRSVVSLIVVFALSGCMTTTASVRETRSSYAWDGLGRESDPRARTPKRTAQKPAVHSPQPEGADELAALPRNSPEWWAAQDKMERDLDAKLAATMVICRGCLGDVEQTGSIPAPRN